MTSNTGTVISVNISEAKGTVKHPVAEALVGTRGLQHDAHAGFDRREVSLLSSELIRQFTAETGRQVAPGDFAENLTTQGLELGGIAPLDRIRIGQVVLEVTQIGKNCHGGDCAIFREVGHCIMPAHGVFCRVLHGGELRPGATLSHEPRTLQFRVITVSDRASQGVYPDRSGPRLRELIMEWAASQRWPVTVDNVLVADDPQTLGAAIREARDQAIDVVLTTGGTGVGPRDITPEVVVMECSKLIPGVMEHIRTKYGNREPRALLSRAVAGVLGHGLVFTLPGSLRAVEEYAQEIFPVLEHLVLMLHGIDAH